MKNQTPKRTAFLKEQLGSWFDFIVSDAELWTEINNALDTIIKLKSRIAPEAENIFNAFKHCPFDKVHTILLSDTPDHRLHTNGKFISNGIPFATDIAFKNTECPKYLKNIVGYIETHISLRSNLEMIDRLKIPLYKLWGKKQSENGFLIVNFNLTTDASDLKLHDKLKIWHHFMFVLIDKLVKTKKVKLILFDSKLEEHMKGLELEFIPDPRNTVNPTDTFKILEKITEEWY